MRCSSVLQLQQATGAAAFLQAATCNQPAEQAIHSSLSKHAAATSLALRQQLDLQLMQNISKMLDWNTKYASTTVLVACLHSTLGSCAQTAEGAAHKEATQCARCTQLIF
jgi:type III secretory pathway component EscV